MDEKIDERTLKAADDAHRRNWDFMMKINESVIANANIALRTALIINGGAAIAMLSFISSLYSAKGIVPPTNFSLLTSPLMWFAWGVSFAAFATALAYFTNYCIVGHASAKSYDFTAPFVHDEPQAKWWLRVAYTCQLGAIVFGFASLGFFVFGMNDVKDAINLFLLGAQ